MQRRNNDNILIKAIYYTKSGIIKEQTFNKEITFGEIINNFKNSNKNKLLTLKNNYKYNGTALLPNQKIINLVYLQKGNSYIIEIKIELNEEEIIDDELEIIQQKIIKPKFPIFSLYIYYPKEGIITSEQYDKEIIKEYNLDTISSGCSYCNSPDFLYISGGGVFSAEPINYFWIIKKDDLKIEKKIIPFGKREHSMIYISNNKVYIIGGNNKKTFFYDIPKNKFINWADLNKEQKRPILISYKNYIYCLGEINKNENFFERTNISNINPSWEKIFPKFKRKVYLFNKKIYFASLCTNNSIIFGAGNHIRDCQLYIYDLINNEISNLNKKTEINELDKAFYKVGKYYNIAFPKNYEIKKNIFLLNKKCKTINEIKFYESNNGIDKIKMEENIYDVNNEENQISNVKIKITRLNEK